MQLVQTTMRSMQGVTEGEVVVATTVGLRRICFVAAGLCTASCMQIQHVAGRYG
jgi:hypothetical protein